MIPETIDGGEGSAEIAIETSFVGILLAELCRSSLG